MNFCDLCMYNTALTSADGPANKEVPVSAIAWQPPLQKVEEPTEILMETTVQKISVSNPTRPF